MSMFGRFFNLYYLNIAIVLPCLKTNIAITSRCILLNNPSDIFSEYLKFIKNSSLRFFVFLNKAFMIRTRKEKKWEWSKPEGSLQTKAKECIFSVLTPQTTDAIQQMTSGHIELRKMFNFNPEQGWYWNWSCNLPSLEYSILTLHQNSHEDQALQVELFVTSKLAGTNTFVDEGVMGVSKQLFQGNSVNFKALKFKTSPDQNQEKLFQLLFVLYYTNLDDSTVIVDSHISPTIFVSPDNASMLNVKTQNLHFLIDPFLPIFIDKELVKRERKNNQYTIQKIENSVQGFNNYFTSSNIRYKIIHPLFLFFKFSSFVRLFVTSELSEKNIEDIVEAIQSNIYQLMAGEKVKKYVILFLNLPRNDETKKKVPISKILYQAIKIIQKLENNYYEIYTEESYLPKKIKEIREIASLVQSYKQQHAHLGELKLKNDQQVQQQSKPQKKQEKMDLVVSSLTCDSNFDKSEDFQILKQEQFVKLENSQRNDQKNQVNQQKEEFQSPKFQNYYHQYNQGWNQRYYYANQANQNSQQQQPYYLNSPQYPYFWHPNYPFL